MQDAKEEVRSRLAIEDVIGEYVQLKRSGRNFKGLSPFSAEKTPSFYVSPDKNIWHDFSSNKGGDVFSFVMEVEGLGFRETLELLARKAGVDLSLYEKGSGDGGRKKKLLIEINERAAQYYQHSLLKNAHALAYATKKRGLNKQVIQDFKIGYAPDSGDALLRFLESRGYEKADIAQAGLLNRFGGDMFRGRLMVSLMDASGQVIGFTGRILADIPNAPKYLNTPQTLIYDKGRHVFGLSQAKEAIRTRDYGVIVEGNLDVVSSHQAGYAQVVATAGTALTEYHLKALSRLTHHVRLAFDGDAAGIAATERAIPIAEEVGVRLSIVSMPEGVKDPDELIQKDPGLWEDAISRAEPVVDWILSQYERREDITTAAGKRAYTSAALQVLGGIKDAVEQEHYLRVVGERTQTSLSALQQKLEAYLRGEKDAPLKPIKQRADLESVSSETAPSLYQDSLLSLFVSDANARDLLRDLDKTVFADEAAQKLLTYLQEHPSETFKQIPADLQNEETYVNILLLKADARYAAWNDQDRYFEAARLLRQVVKEHKQKQKEVLTRELREAEDLGDEDKATTIRSQLYALIKEIQSAQR